MSKDLGLRRLDPAESKLRNAILTSQIEGLEIARLLPDIRYVCLEAQSGKKTHRVLIPLQQLVDFWLRDASIPAEAIDEDIVREFLCDEFQAQGLPSPFEALIWQSVAGFASDDDRCAPVARMRMTPFDLYLREMPGALAASPEVLQDTPVNTRWALGTIRLPARTLAGLAVGDALMLASKPGTFFAGEVALFSFHLQGEFFILDTLHDEYVEHEAADEEHPRDATSGIAVEDLPVTVSFVLSKRTMRVADVGSLQPGMTVPLELLSPQIDMIAGGKLLARGELVRIGESLGVEITRTTPVAPGETFDIAS